MSDTAVATILARLDRFDLDVTARFAKLEGGVSRRFSRLEQEVGNRLSGLEVRLGRIEAKIDEKPGHADVWRASATMIALAFALVGGTVAVLKSSGVIP